MTMINDGVNQDTQENTGDGIFGDFDFDILIKLQEAMGKFDEKDKNTDLLAALKPHMSESRQAKVDKAIKLMKMAAVFEVVKESGLLKDMF